MTKLTREEKAISCEIEALEQYDPLFRSRIKVHLQRARQVLTFMIKDPGASPEEVQETIRQVKEYGKYFDVIMKLETILEGTKEDAFAQANVTAQQQEADKLGCSTGGGYT